MRQKCVVFCGITVCVHVHAHLTSTGMVAPTLPFSSVRCHHHTVVSIPWRVHASTHTWKHHRFRGGVPYTVVLGVQFDGGCAPAVGFGPLPTSSLAVSSLEFFPDGPDDPAVIDTLPRCLHQPLSRTPLGHRGHVPFLRSRMWGAPRAGTNSVDPPALYRSTESRDAKSASPTSTASAS